VKKEPGCRAGLFPDRSDLRRRQAMKSKFDAVIVGSAAIASAPVTVLMLATTLMSAKGSLRSDE
jgi:hypothetical protein